MTLLELGLDHVDAVAYIEDDTDKQMVVYRNGTTRLLGLCGLPPDRRFTFYDQVHSTGQDIRQAPLATAFVTIGKDMTFRDLSQGAWRMRALDQGQTIRLLLPPEIRHMIEGAGGPACDPSSLVQKRLVDIAVWLVVKGHSAEHAQQKVLVGQNALNIMRKHAFSKLLAIAQRFRGAEELPDIMDLFIESKDLSAASNLLCYSDRLIGFVEAHKSIVPPDVLDRVYNTLDRISPGTASNPGRRKTLDLFTDDFADSEDSDWDAPASNGRDDYDDDYGAKALGLVAADEYDLAQEVCFCILLLYCLSYYTA